MSTEKIVKLKIGEGDSWSTIKVVWEETFFSITILEGKNAWYSLIAIKDLPAIAVKLDQNFDSYTKNLNSYLVNPDKHEDITFDIVNNEFVVYKNISQKLRVKCFFTKLEKRDYSRCSEAIVDELLSKNAFLENQLSELQEIINKEIKERSSITEKYLDLKNKIENTEKELHSSFILLLNEKKKRIQYLNEVIDSQRNRPLLLADNKIKTDIKTEGNGEIESNDKNDSERISDSEEEQPPSNFDAKSYDTDDEVTQKLNERPTFDISRPSTSKDDIVSLLATSSKSVTLPKRAKYDHQEDKILPMKPQSPINGNIPEKSETSKKEEESPVEFNTQDMLERM